MFADRYIQNNIVYPSFIKEEVSPALSVIVMIPCLNEPEIIRTLESVWACEPVDSFCEVLVVVNDSESSPEPVKAINRETFIQLLDWKQANDRSNLVLHPFYVPSVQAKFAGAGMARKIGMDEAIRRFNAVNRPEGVIVSLDSDCLVSSNYLKRIETVFSESKSCFAATINFRHRFEEMEDPRQEAGIRMYEDYLHYYKQALDFAGFPNSIYTIGSAFAVRADAYVKQGGMNRRQAGEDFYFLHKLTKLGRLAEITDAFVYPSGRVSDRVPFGTGAAMTKWKNFTEDL
ncbi:MAG: family 2 glycosyl transferase, partial [Bacteroidota bacterium]|nr:family 2 glycosyl transferase [Bacteroidota bacterium]